jgi:small subunit ribosomal protein S4
MTSVQIPHSVAAALPTLSVFDITNEVSRDVASDRARRGIAYVTAALTAAENRQRQSWVEVDKGTFTGTVKTMPVRDEMNEPAIREQYVVEYYSR